MQCRFICFIKAKWWWRERKKNTNLNPVLCWGKTNDINRKYFFLSLHWIKRFMDCICTSAHPYIFHKHTDNECTFVWSFSLANSTSTCELLSYTFAKIFRLNNEMHEFIWIENISVKLFQNIVLHKFFFRCFSKNIWLEWKKVTHSFELTIYTILERAQMFDINSIVK